MSANDFLVYVLLKQLVDTIGKVLQLKNTFKQLLKRRTKCKLMLEIYFKIRNII